MYNDYRVLHPTHKEGYTMSKPTSTLAYTTKGGTSVNLSMIENPSTLKESKLHYIYHVSYTGERRERKYSRKFVLTSHDYPIFMNYKNVESVPHLKRYDFCIDEFIDMIHNDEQVSESMHYQLFNLATSFTIKGAKKVAFMQGKYDMMQETDLIETRNTGYASLLVAINEGQFKEGVTLYVDELHKDDCDDEVLAMLKGAIIKAIAGVVYTKLNAYTYQLHRNSRHLDIDTWTEDKNGDLYPMIDNIISEHVSKFYERRAISDLMDKMNVEQVESIHKALSKPKHLERYKALLNRLVEGKPLNDADARFYQRSNIKIREVYSQIQKEG